MRLSLPWGRCDSDIHAALALFILMFPGASTRRPSYKPSKAAGNRTIVHAKPLNMSLWMPVARSSWRIGSKCVSPVSSRHLEYLILVGQLNVKLRSQTSSLTTKAGKVTVRGSNANVSHTINEDERREFTNHINGVRMNLSWQCLRLMTTVPS